MSNLTLKKKGSEFAKKYFGEKVTRQVLNYLAKDTEKNLFTMIGLAEKFAPVKTHREQARELRIALQKYPQYMEYVKRIISSVNPNVRKTLGINLFVNALILGIPKQQETSGKLGVHIPFAILIDPTSRCNLSCIGCWAGAYPTHDTLDFDILDRLLTQAKELGIYFISISGGEPFLYKRLIDLAEKHNEMCFNIYTNGTLIDGQMAERLAGLGNISPAISLEGFEEQTDARRGKGVFTKITTAMENLKKAGVFFGFSLTVTRKNFDVAISEEFYDFLIKQGCLYGWSFHYIPIGRDPDLDLMLYPEQRLYLVERIRHIRHSKGFPVADFWNDGELTEGCIAGGRRYFHITAKGDIEPCAFVHFSSDNIFGKNLTEILKTPIFQAYQKRQPFSTNYLRPCPIIDHPDLLREIVRESTAVETHEGAVSILQGKAGEYLDNLSRVWAQSSDPIWERLISRK